MTIRRLMIAALLASAGVAHADTISQPAPPSTVVSGWTTGNGTDVLGSGVLQGNLNLVGGVAYTSGAGANASLADVLYGKVSASIANVNGQTQLFFQRGIEANYLLASGHGILAATLGPGMSVVGSANGAAISKGVTTATAMSGGGSLNGASTNAVAAAAGTGATTSTTASAGTGASSTTASNTSAGAYDGTRSTIVLGAEQSNNRDSNGLVIPLLETPAAEVPEPSSIALMLLGMVGAGAMTRRRRC